MHHCLYFLQVDSSTTLSEKTLFIPCNILIALLHSCSNLGVLLSTETCSVSPRNIRILLHLVFTGITSSEGSLCILHAWEWWLMVILGSGKTNNEIIPCHSLGFKVWKRESVELLKNKFSKNEIRTRLQLANKNQMYQKGGKSKSSDIIKEKVNINISQNRQKNSKSSEVALLKKKTLYRIYQLPVFPPPATL